MSNTSESIKQLVELIVGGLRHAQQIIPGLGRRIAPRVALKQLHPQPLLQRFEAATPSQPSRIMCQIGAIQATGQPVPVPLLALALQELRYPQPVVDACSQGHPLGQEILLKVGRAAQDAHRAASTNGTRTGQASAEELAAFRAFQDSKRAQQAAQDSPKPPPAPAPAAPPGPYPASMASS